ncbi:PREDICTED: uncharacterized protein LOC102005196, partial [Chinchilla lanigera]|uniref:uncharacterized protein LOC102005196 n=1 Tax=Chinchilla lanigera TaxID=34839 RepID=UPI000697D925
RARAARGCRRCRGGSVRLLVPGSRAGTLAPQPAGGAAGEVRAARRPASGDGPARLPARPGRARHCPGARRPCASGKRVCGSDALRRSRNVRTRRFLLRVLPASYACYGKEVALAGGVTRVCLPESLNSLRKTALRLNVWEKQKEKYSSLKAGIPGVPEVGDYGRRGEGRGCRCLGAQPRGRPGADTGGKPGSSEPASAVAPEFVGGDAYSSRTHPSLVASCSDIFRTGLPASTHLPETYPQQRQIY